MIGDDAIDADGDGTPAGCDCDDADGDVASDCGSDSASVGSSGDTGVGGAGGGKEGCNCDSSGNRAPVWPWLVMLTLAARRRLS